MTPLPDCFCPDCRLFAGLREALAAARADAERAVRERDRALALALRWVERCCGQAEAKRAEGMP